MIVFLYFVATLFVALSHPLSHSWMYAACITLGCFVAMVAGTTLQAAFQDGAWGRKTGFAIMATILMLMAQTSMHSFTLLFFGHYLSGIAWIWIGFVIAFFFNTPRLSAS